MDSVDIKGIAWVGNIYRKFEAMCMEVEEAMCQETAKYVENQVQTVGASMKRFCSDVMQDLLPPSSKDLARVASAELLLNPYLEFGIHKRSISSIKEDAIDPVRIKGSSEDKSNSSNDAWENWSAASFNWDISDKDEASCDQMASNEALKSEPRGEQEEKICNQIVNTSFGSPATITAMSSISSSKVVKRSRRISTSNNTIKAESTDTGESRSSASHMGSHVTSDTSICQSSNGDVPHTDSSESSRCVSSSETGSRVSSNTQCGQPVADEAFRSHTGSNSTKSLNGYSGCASFLTGQTGSSTDFDPDIKEDNHTSIQMMEHIGHGYEESGFEETCVLVDGSDYCLNNHKEEIKRSYKKKIQSAFSLKKKSSRKQEYKQFAVQYGNIDAEPNIQGKEATPLAITLSKNIKAKNSTTLDSLDSEWELL